MGCANGSEGGGGAGLTGANRLDCEPILLEPLLSRLEDSLRTHSISFSVLILLKWDNFRFSINSLINESKFMWLSRKALAMSSLCSSTSAVAVCISASLVSKDVCRDTSESRHFFLSISSLSCLSSLWPSIRVCLFWR